VRLHDKKKGVVPDAFDRDGFDMRREISEISEILFALISLISR
jgi:hypothetical protein